MNEYEALLNSYSTIGLAKYGCHLNSYKNSIYSGCAFFVLPAITLNGYKNHTI